MEKVVWVPFKIQVTELFNTTKIVFYFISIMIECYMIIYINIIYSNFLLIFSIFFIFKLYY
jgi:hypothetical protein